MFAGNELLTLSGAGRTPAGAPTARGRTMSQIKATRVWQESRWREWPREEDWPQYLDVYEAAAIVRVSPDTIRRALVTDRLGRASLRHFRYGASIRIRKADMLKFGVVPDRQSSPIL